MVYTALIHPSPINNRKAPMLRAALFYIAVLAWALHYKPFHRQQVNILHNPRHLPGTMYRSYTTRVFHLLRNHSITF